MKITQENFESAYVDTIERQQIDHFVCKEMDRQIHRYIKGMSGSKKMMDRFIEHLSHLSDADKAVAIASYIDLNRRVLDGLDFKMVLVRAVANYCDTYQYFLQMVNDSRKMIYYYQRMKQMYVQYHEVFEENGKFGIKDYQGRVILSASYDFLRTPYVYVDDMRQMPVIAQRGGKMGLVLLDGDDTCVADFVYDDIQLRDEPPFFEARQGDEISLLDV